MLKRVTVIADASGSMASQGKRGITLLALRSIRYLAEAAGGGGREPVEVRLFSCGGGLIELASPEELPPAAGVFDFAALYPLLREAPVEKGAAGGEAICLLSDGCFDREAAEAFARHCAERGITLLCAACGSDSGKNWFRWKAAPRVCEAADIANALAEEMARYG